MTPHDQPADLVGDARGGERRQTMRTFLVYIASPYTVGDVALNVRNSLQAADELASAGFLVYAPLLSHFWHMMFPHPYEFWTKMDLEWVLRADAVLRLPGQSKGADTEVRLAMDYKLPIFTTPRELIEFFATENDRLLRESDPA